MTDEERSKAMDNLIAQDADLIDVDGRIAELEREKSAMSELLDQQKELALEYLFDCNRAGQRIAELEAALRSLIENYAPIGEPGYLWPEARKALGETKC